ncbi:MAG: Crp/Fnr family transcriptional regulator [Pseudomonadota bacterium]
MPTLNNLVPTPVQNHLIQSLPDDLRNRLLSLCDTVELTFGSTLCEPEKPFQYVYFPITAFISLVTTLRDHQPLEMGLVGNEGMLGATLALGINSAQMLAIVQGSGTALRINAEQLRQELRESPALMRACNRYLFVLMTQLAQAAACAHFHEIQPRVARWLLMIHDRAHSDNIYLTQEFLAHMLGVRRSTITVAAGALQKRNLITYSRGTITILDRKSLERASCECYDALIKHYRQIFE